MLKKLKHLVELTRNARGQSVSMGRRLLIYWCSMALVVFAAVMLLLSGGGVFSGTEERLEQALALQHENNAALLDARIGSLTAQGIYLSEEISRILKQDCGVTSVDELNNDGEKLQILEGAACTLMNGTIKSASFNGIYFIADATINTAAPAADTSRAGVYLRFANLSTRDSVLQDVVCYRGIPEVARANRLELHNRWNLEFDIEYIPGYDAIEKASVQRLADSCYWTGRIRLTDTWEKVMLLVVPVLDGEGKVGGVCGVELSDQYFRLLYPCCDSEFGNMVTVLAPVREGELLLSKGMVGCPGGTYLDDIDTLKITGGRSFFTYEGEGHTYYGIQTPLGMKTADGEEMCAVTLVPEDGYSAVALRYRLLLTGGFLLLLCLTLALSCYLSRRFLRPIAAGLDALKSEPGEELPLSGILEIDEIIAYLRHKTATADDGELPPNIEELFCGFVQRVNTLTPMERTILQYYIEGCSMEDVAEKAYISINTVKKHNTNLNRKLGVRSREELLLYIDLFRRCDRLEEIGYRK